MIALHSILSYPTNQSSIPDLLSRIYYDASHDSSSKWDNHDEKGRNSPPQACETLLTKYDTSGKGGLNFREVRRLWTDQRSQLGTYGWCTAVIECELHCQPKDCPGC